MEKYQQGCPYFESKFPSSRDVKVDDWVSLILIQNWKYKGRNDWVNPVGGDYLVGAILILNWECKGGHFFNR